jgi:fumarate reductase flavoprotein subunit
MAVLKAEGRTFPTTTEVLVIGAGACGTIAALAAKERGAEVVILERDAKPSGSTSLSSGQIPAAGTKLQRAAGLMDDTPDLLYQDILAKSHGECDHAIARLIADESKNTVEWLVERQQVPLSCVLNFQYPGHSRRSCMRRCSPRWSATRSRSPPPRTPPTSMPTPAAACAACASPAPTARPRTSAARR